MSAPSSLYNYFSASKNASSEERASTLPSMAATAGMSRSAFAAVFKEVMQATPASYLLDWRLSLACAQLRAGVAVKQVAIEVGFADTASLSKAFRKRLGASPRAWLAATAAQVG